jgi:hypothetical protein
MYKQKERTNNMRKKWTPPTIEIYKVVTFILINLLALTLFYFDDFISFKTLKFVIYSIFAFNFTSMFYFLYKVLKSGSN